MTPTNETREVLIEQVTVLRAQLDASRRRYAEARRQLAEVHASHTFRLSSALKDRPMTFAKLMLACRLFAEILLPRSLRSSVSKDALRVDGVRPSPEVDRRAAGNAYVVRTPDAKLDNRPRVLHAIANVMTGGSSRLVVDLIEHMGDFYEQRVLTGFLPVPAAYDLLPVIEVREPVPVAAMDAVIASFRPDIIHVHYWGDIDEAWYASVFRAATLAKIPVIQNINTPVEPFPLAGARNVFVSRYVHRVFGGSDPLAQVIYPGSDLSLFSRQDGEVVPDDCVGMVYRLDRDKLNEESIECFIEIVKRRPNTRALIIGGGHFLGAYRARVAEEHLNDSFEFTGDVRYLDLPGFYKRLSVFVAPVWNESFGQVAPFAMSMSIPVVGYNVGAIPEIIDDKSLVAPRGDTKGLAQIAIGLLDDRLRRLEIGRSNHARVQTLFSIEAMIAKYRSLYADVLSKKAMA